MTYAEASEMLKSEFGMNLLECLEQVKYNLEHDIPTSRLVRVAYFVLMAGFTEMMGE